MARVITELQKLSAEDLAKRVAELKVQLVQQKQARAAGELANPHAIKRTRREIAVALTLINEASKQAEMDTMQESNEHRKQSGATDAEMRQLDASAQPKKEEA